MSNEHFRRKGSVSRSAGHRHRSARRAVRAGLAVAAATVTALASAGVATAAPAAPTPAGTAQAAPSAQPDLGPHVTVFDPSMPTAQIQAAVDAVTAEQVSNQFGTQRYALLFKPGTYGTPAEPLIIQVGYYTEVAGLGLSPGDVTLNGHVDVYNQCHPTAPGAPTDCTALDNFWRSVSNLTINVEGAGLDGCRASANFWAVSQAAPMRRVNLTGGNLTLQDYCTAPPQYASGGFIADSAFAGGTVINGGQQQFFTRNSNLDGWSNGVWNQVFAGTVGAPDQSFPDPPYTTLATTPASREKPYLYLDDSGSYRVFVPAAQTDTRGTSWQDGATAGRSLPISDFLVVHPSDSVSTMNQALSRGLNLLITPGVYDVAQTIKITRADTVVLGMGVATLTAQQGAVPMSVDDVPGVDIAGIMFDAGPVNSPVLLQVGKANGNNHQGSAADPTALQDVFFRIGGPHVGKATVSLEVNSDHVILDDIWAWRADHGTGVGWTVNTADTGIIVNGDDVTATGLFDEHYQKYGLIWNGERGTTIFYQNELPYDPPNQAAWSHDGLAGWAAYKVADSVKTHQAWGLGSYIFTNVDPTLHASHGFEVPVTPGVQMHDLLTISLNKAGTIDHVINDTGAAVTPTFQGPVNVVSYPVPGDVYLRAYLTGGREVPGPGDRDGRAVLAIRIHGDSIDFGTRWEAIGTPQAGHIHLGAAGTAGPVDVPFFTTPLPDGTTAVNGTVNNVDADLIARLKADPSDFYANLHTAEFPAGAIRGQFVPSGPQDLSAVPFPVALSTAMTGAQEVGPADPAATAGGFVRARGTKVEYAFTLDRLTSPTGGHLHRGVAGVDGPIVVPFFELPAGLPPTITGIAGRVYGVNAALVKDIATHPSDYYLNLHTATYPAGAVRGQLG